MFGLESLDVMIGLATVYLTFGIACTAVVEAVSAWFNVRSKNLETALGEFLHGDIACSKSFTKAFYDHPLVQALSKGKEGRPSYIAPDTVSQVIEDLLMAKEAAASFTQAVDKLPGTPEENRIKGLLGSLASRADNDVAAFRAAVEAHFDTVMDRASGWFKRYSQAVAFAAAALLVVGVNVDTVEMAISLASNPAARQKAVEAAQLMVTNAQSNPAMRFQPPGSSNPEIVKAADKVKEANEALARATANLENTGLRLGWKQCPKTGQEWISKIFGLLVSICAVSLGAPFWFDVLQGLMKLRTSGATPAEKKAQNK